MDIEILKEKWFNYVYVCIAMTIIVVLGVVFLLWPGYSQVEDFFGSCVLFPLASWTCLVHICCMQWTVKILNASRPLTTKHHVWYKIVLVGNFIYIVVFGICGIWLIIYK